MVQPPENGDTAEVPQVDWHGYSSEYKKELRHKGALVRKIDRLLLTSAIIVFISLIVCVGIGVWLGLSRDYIAMGVDFLPTATLAEVFRRLVSDLVKRAKEADDFLRSMGGR